MTQPFRGFGYLAALALAATGFMFGSTMLFTIILWALAWVPASFWLSLPLLLFMALLECVVFILTMSMIRSGERVRRWSLLNAWLILWTSVSMSFRIWQLAYIVIFGYVTELAKAKDHSAYSGGRKNTRFPMKPIREQISRQFMGFCH